MLHFLFAALTTVACAVVASIMANPSHLPPTNALTAKDVVSNEALMSLLGTVPKTEQHANGSVWIFDNYDYNAKVLRLSSDLVDQNVLSVVQKRDGTLQAEFHPNINKFFRNNETVRKHVPEWFIPVSASLSSTKSYIDIKEDYWQHYLACKGHVHTCKNGILYKGSVSEIFDENITNITQSFASICIHPQGMMYGILESDNKDEIVKQTARLNMLDDLKLKNVSNYNYWHGNLQKTGTYGAMNQARYLKRQSNRNHSDVFSALRLQGIKQECKSINTHIPPHLNGIIHDISCEPDYAVDIYSVQS